MSANTRFETLEDVVRKDGNLRVQCSCRHWHVFDGGRLSRWFRCHGWDTRMHMLRERLKCGRCGKRPERVRPTAEKPTARDPFPIDEQGWERLVKNLRR